MKALHESIAEARHSLANIRNLLKEAGHQLGHDVESCACDICKSKRLLDEAVQRTGNVERPLFEREW